SITVIGGSLTLLIAPAWSQSAERVVIDLPAQSLANSLVSLASQTGVDIVAPGSLVSDRTAPALSGAFTPEEAAQTLISGSNLDVRTGSTGSLIITRLEASEDDADVLLDEVLITTRRTAEDIRDVPGSVAVVTGEEFERSNTGNTAETVLRVPNVSLNGNSPGEINLSIRGISNTIGSLATGPTNGVFQNGVLLNPTGTTSALNGSTVDLERVEVAFGPQGTAFGRGTIGGAINFVTKKPTNEFEASFEGEVGSFPDGRGTAIINTPVFENNLLNARLVAFGGASDGFINFDSIFGPDSNTNNEAGFRFSLRSQPTDRLTLDTSVSYDFTRLDADRSATLESIAAGDPTTLATFIDEDSIERLLFSFEGVYDADIGSIKSTTSFLRSEFKVNEDSDFTPLDFLSGPTDVDERSIAQEFRFESESFSLPESLGAASFNLGTSISFNENSIVSVTDPGADLFAFLIAPGVPDDGSTAVTTSLQDVFTFGVFGDVRWNPIERLELAAGARFSLDEVTVDGETISTGTTAFLVPPSPLQTGSETFTSVTPNASVKYDWTDDFSTYVAFSTGFRPGGFGASIFGFTTFEEERARNIEGGFRARLFDDKVSVSGTGFFIDYDDLQVVALDIVGGLPVETVTNAASARSVGAEIGVAVRPIDGLNIETQTGLNFASFTDFTAAPDFDLDGTPDDLSGTALPNAPRFTTSIVGDYQHPAEIFPGASVFVRAEYSFRGSATILLTPADATADSFSLLNLRAGLRGDNFSVEGFVENVLDATTVTGASPIAVAGPLGLDQELVIGPTRRFGVRGKITF
ncbi:MAG: TonB-dependent receptor, partial [Pseudomonadota bacterium]